MIICFVLGRVRFFLVNEPVRVRLARRVISNISSLRLDIRVPQRTVWQTVLDPCSTRCVERHDTSHLDTNFGRPTRQDTADSASKTHHTARVGMQTSKRHRIESFNTWNIFIEIDKKKKRHKWWFLDYYWRIPSCFFVFAPMRLSFPHIRPEPYRKRRQRRRRQV